MSNMQTFDTFHSRIILRAYLVAETGLHPGAGSSLEPVGSDSPVLRDTYGRPYIPGSSFKGVLRSTIEGIIRGINYQGPKGIQSCDIIRDECVKKELRNELKKRYKEGKDRDKKFTEELLQRSCSVCRLFGSPWLASKVLIKDLYCTDLWPGYIEVRDGVGIDRDTETAVPKRKYDYEVVPKATEFDLEIIAENADDIELGLLFIGLREFEKGYASLGGLVSRGLGKVKLQWEKMELIGNGGASLLDYIRNGGGKKIYPKKTKVEKGLKEEPKTKENPLENAFKLLGKAILAIEKEDQPPSLSRLPQILKNMFGFEPHQVGLPKYGKDFIPEAEKAGWVKREGDIIRLMDEKRSLLLGESGQEGAQKQNEEINQKETYEFIEDFIQDKIDKLIEELSKGGDHAQKTA